MPLSILSYAQHLLGVGHVFRAKRVAEAAAARGHTVTLVLGGAPVPGLSVPGVDVRQLPPLRSRDATYQVIETPDGRPLDDGIMRARTDALCEVFEACTPDVLMIEGFPLARRKFRFELIPLLQAAHARASRPLVVVSARDVLQRPARASRIEEALVTFETYCDALLLHGDADTSGALAAFPELARLREATYYTGVVAPPPSAMQPPADPEMRADVIVSAGGGSVGVPLVRAAMRAKPQSVMRDRRWLVLTGPNCPDDAFDAFRALGQEQAIRVERFVPNLNQLLQTADISIQQVGYNTVADLLTTSCRAVFVPFAEHGQSEQPARAAALAAAGRGVVVDVADADAAPTPEAVADALERAASLPRPTPRTDLNGAARSVDIIEQLSAMHRERPRGG